MLKLVVLGDSIAKGYGSSKEAPGGFSSILAEKLDADLTNLGIVGLDSEGLMEKLNTEKFETAIAEGDVVCLSIGSNDLLKPFLSILAEDLGVKGEQKELYEKIQEKLASTARKNPLKAADLLSTSMKHLTGNRTLLAACEDFSGNLGQIVTRIREINPDVVIYVNNVYNPYYSVAYEYEGISIFNVSQLCEPYVQKLNAGFRPGKEYSLVDVYSIMRQEGYTHVYSGTLENMKGINLDPHPNDAGYRLIADYVYVHMDSLAPRIVDAWFSSGEAPGQESITVQFSEPVRLVEGGSMVIADQTGEDRFLLEFEENTWIREDSEGACRLQVELSRFSYDSRIWEMDPKAGERYQVFFPDGSVKDKGNNHLSEDVCLEFQMPLPEEAQTTLSHGGVQEPIPSQRTWKREGLLGLGLVIAGILFLLLLMGALVRRRKKARGKTSEKT